MVAMLGQQDGNIVDAPRASGVFATSSGGSGEATIREAKLRFLTRILKTQIIP